MAPVDKPTALAAALERKDAKLDKQRSETQRGDGVVSIEIPICAHHGRSKRRCDEEIES
jgi:hypothetical protein